MATSRDFTRALYKHLRNSWSMLFDLSILNLSGDVCYTYLSCILRKTIFFAYAKTKEEANDQVVSAEPKTSEKK